MKIRLGLILLSFACLLSTANSQCDLGPGSRDVPFPDIHKYVADSYIMGVEYSVPLAQQTDYYTEYYEIEFHKGRIDGHQAGNSFKYMYNADNWESWNVELNKCELRNITQMPEFYKDDMTDWVHNKGTPQWTTVGPSAMFKVAYDVWNNPKEKNLMTYKGRLENATVRGEKAVYYRRCLEAYSYVEYYFGAPDQEDAFDVEMFGKKFTPLRVIFFNLTGKDETMASQFYDILFFQHSIPSDMEPFALPKGRNCSRDVRVTGPAMPNFNGNNMFLSAEVLYQKFKLSKDENQEMSSYYSTLMFSVNHDIGHIMYYYSSWNTTKPDPDHQLPFVNMPHKIIYDTEHEYTYKINTASGKCTMSRDKSFSPTYKLPEGGGGINLADPLILFPNNEFVYLDKSRERGLRVNVYEVALLDYILDSETIIPKMVATHSYLTEDEEVQNTQAIKNSPTQIELHMYRKDDIEEVLTFNIYGFTTKLPQRMRRRTFDVSQCFKNDDDYMYLTIGFQPDEKYIPELTKKLDDVEDRIIESIKLKSTLNAVRIPYVVSEVRNNFILVTLLILDKPAPVFEFTDIMVDKTVKVGTEDDKQGVSTFEVCADQCLEGRNECWGFALCGGTCSYGSDENQEVIDKKGCTVYKRYNNKTALQSNAFEVNNIVGAVESGQFPVEVTLDQGRVPLKAVVAQITDPAEDESLYTKMGNLLNPRMRVIKTATKLKKGDEVKNMGKLRYDECQQLCLDFKDCETLSYCLVDSNCKLSSKFAIDLNMKEDTEPDNFCNLLSRKYADHFDRTPGVFATPDGGTKVEAKTVEDCARECLKTENNNCMSFDHCAGGEFDGCRLYNIHYKKTGSKMPADNNNARCGHYSRKFSAEFKMKDKTRITGKVFQELTNLTLEECAKRCIEYDGGACYGYDFCQGEEIFSTWCYLIDSDPSQYKSDFSAICRNYLRTSGEYAPRPYTSAYAGGIGFLCFVVGGIIGIALIFAIAYIRVNRG